MTITVTPLPIYTMIPDLAAGLELWAGFQPEVPDVAGMTPLEEADFYSLAPDPAVQGVVLKTLEGMKSAWRFSEASFIPPPPSVLPDRHRSITARNRGTQYLNAGELSIVSPEFNLIKIISISDGGHILSSVLCLK
ncbi:MAG: hypothetical protein HY609_05480 [Deltaproteobacteria bacterium]|nr:hypothetical protein [Deltaproteobacteria bacterium]MBI4224365.1 hypothetical protein [Deltaproteobacteria bacterium]